MRLVCSLLLAFLLSAPMQALTRVEIPGGIYADALPSRAFVVNVAGAVRTHLGETLPTEPLMFLRITEAGGFKVAGSSNITGQVWVLDGGVWRLDGRLSHGAQGHGFTPDGRLVVLPPVGAQDSQGLRYYDASLPVDLANYDTTQTTVGFVTGSASYSPFTPLAQLLGIQHLFEWTAYDGIAVGQGEGGAVVQYRGRHYLLEAGDTRFIQFHKSGSSLAIAMSKLRERAAVIIWMDESEIASLPPYVVPTPAPPVPPAPPAPAPAPTPAPPPAPRPQVDDARARAIVDAERASRGHMAKPEIALFLQAIARRLNAEGVAGGPFGVLRKESGNQCEGLACDIICTGNGDAQRQWDVLVDEDGAQSAAWSRVEQIAVRECVAPAEAPVPPQPPVPPPPPSCAACERTLQERTTERDAAREEREALRAQVHNLTNERNDAARERDELQKKLWEIQSKPQPTCTASIFGIKIPCRVIQPQ